MDNNQNIPDSVRNQRVLELMDRGEMTKVAQASTEFIRTQIREDAFTFKIIPFEKATDDMLDRGLDERLRFIRELEPDSPGAKWVSLEGVPEGEYMVGPRYEIPVARLVTPRLVKNIDELRTYKMDLRKVLLSNTIKDGEAEIDRKLIDTCTAIVTDTAGVVPNVAQTYTGKVQWTGFSGGLTRENFIEAKKMLPRGNSSGKYRLRNYIALMNEVTAQDWMKLSALEVGDETVKQMFKEGLTTDTYLGVKCIFTIKSDIVGDNKVWFFAAPEFLGNGYILQDWTTYMKKEAYFIELFSYWLGGFSIGNIAAVALADFDFA